MKKRKKLMNSILYSSIGTLTAALVTVCLIFSVSVYIRYSSSIKNELYRTVSAEGEKMNTWFERHSAITESFAAAAVQENLHGDKLQQYIRNVVNPCSENIMDSYLAWETDTSGMVCGIFPVDDDYVAQERDWYKAAVEKKGTIITEPYVDVATGNLVITIAAPLKSGNEILGACGLDIEVTELVTLSNNLRADNSGYAVLIDSIDNVVVHSKNNELTHHLSGEDEVITRFTDISPDFDKVLLSADNPKVISGKGFDGAHRFFPIVNIGNSGWKLMYAADFYEAMRPINLIIGAAVVISVLAIVCGGLFFYIKFTGRLKPLSDIETIVKNMADGILDHNYPNTHVNDEIGVICACLKETNSSLKEYIDEIDGILSEMSDGNFSENSGNIRFVGEFSSLNGSISNIRAEFQNTFSHLSTVAEQISKGSGNVSDGASELAQAVADETRIVDSVSERLNNISVQLSDSADNASSVKSKVAKTNKALTVSNEKMRELTEIMNNISKSASEIIKINSAIEDISFQTNILALNASVEAARAGDAGKGFMVVAEDVRNLAEKSAEASSTTSRLIIDTVSKIENGTVAANETYKMLDEVSRETDIINSSVTQIADVSNSQKTIISEIAENLNEVRKVIVSTSENAKQSALLSADLDNQVDVLKKSLDTYIV